MSATADPRDFAQEQPQQQPHKSQYQQQEVHSDNTDTAEPTLAPTRHDSKLGGVRRDSTGDSGSTSITEPRDALAAVETRNDQVTTSNGHRHAAALPTIDTTITRSAYPPLAHRNPRHANLAGAGLHLRTNVDSSPMLLDESLARLNETPTIYETPVSAEAGSHQSLMSPTQMGAGVSASLRSNLSTSSMTSSLSPGSTLASPYLSTMTDLTPLPSPLVGSDSAAPWRRAQPGTPNRSREGSLEDATPIARQSLPASPPSRKRYGSLVQEATTANAAAVQGNTQSVSGGKAHGRNRSISDFVPESLHNVRHRHVTFGPGDGASMEALEYSMQREAYLAAQRGLTAPTVDPAKQLPTPPASNSSVAESDEADDEQPFLEDGSTPEYLEIYCGIHHKRRKFRQLRQLGQGTFSKVMLATREHVPAHITPEIEEFLDTQKIVAVKIVEHGPAGGADEERIETGLKREVEMLKSVSHPSLIHLKACEYQETRALLVLTYCPGGDLFEFASQKRDLLTAPMVQRMFAELVGAVRYLHQHWIVHRDIKLENVLVNLRPDALRSIHDPPSLLSLIHI